MLVHESSSIGRRRRVGRAGFAVHSLRQSRSPAGTARRKMVVTTAAAAVLVAAAAAPTSRAATFEQAVALHTAGRSREALAAYHSVVRSEAPPEERAAALNNACVLAGELGDQATALADCEAALRLRRTLGDPAAVAETANNLALVLEVTGRPAAAAERYGEALAINRK